MYYLYILKCRDESLYTGITTDLKRRVAQHNGVRTRGAGYTSTRRPVELVFSKEYNNRSEATREEARVKKLKRVDKLALIIGRA